MGWFGTTEMTRLHSSTVGIRGGTDLFRATVVDPAHPLRNVTALLKLVAELSVVLVQVQG